MGPTIILDKSALQMLSFAELTVFHNNYMLNIVPTLVVEILGDIKKPSKQGLSKNKVKELACKITPYGSTINAYYKPLIMNSIMGKNISLSGRTVLCGGSYVKAPDGEVGVVIEESAEEKALLRWRSGEFEETEEILGERWRESTRSIDLEGMKKNFQNLISPNEAIKNLDDLDEFVNSYLNNPKFQTNLMVSAIEQFNIPLEYCQRIFHEWESTDRKPISQYAPYAFHCMKVNLFFVLALTNNLVGTRPTNVVDLEYLYYTPFCMVFCSNDDFQLNMAKYFLNEDQELIKGSDLKEDLKNMFGEGRKNSSSGTEATLTDRLWSKFMKGPRGQENFADKLDDAAQEKLVNFINSKIKGERIHSSHHENGSEPDFIARETSIRWDDPCPCGSGKLFKDCHGLKVKESKVKKEK